MSLLVTVWVIIADTLLKYVTTCDCRVWVIIADILLKYVTTCDCVGDQSAWPVVPQDKILSVKIEYLTEIE